ncbi:MAG: DUF5663 domain-containing protein [Parcubacteria group bacterium]|jgi:hypothetical protein
MDNQTQIQKTIIEELGLVDLPKEKQDQLLIKMTEVVLKRIFLEIMEKLNETDQKIYEKMIDENAEPEKLEEFLREKITNYDKIIARVIADFKEEMKSV